jgi:hypothetical protein
MPSPWPGRSSAQPARDHLGSKRVSVAKTCALILLAVVLAGCGGWEGGKKPGTQTVLEIKAWPDGKDAGPAREWRLHCELAGGTHPTPEKACETAPRPG